MSMKQDPTLNTVYGIHPVLELLKAKKRPIATIYTTKEPIKSWNEISKLIPSKIRVQHIGKDALARIAGSADHQGIVALATPFVYRTKPFDSAKEPFILVLDRIQDPRNVGAIIRSAYCAGIQGVILIKKGGCLINAPALKASAGLAEHMPIYLAASSASAQQELRAAGYSIYVGALGGEALQKVSFKTPCCLVVGNEATGIAPEFRKNSTLFMLPQRAKDISYNASVAAGIMAFWVSLSLGYITH